MEAVSIKSKEGDFLAWFSEQGLARLDFPAADRRRRRNNGENRKTSNPPEVERWKKLTTQALEEALAGRAPKALPPLDLSGGTEFQRQVWKALRQIPPGATRTYAQVAGAVRKPLASRAVGGACGANPIPVFVPCHRVVASGGGLGGFSGGLSWKRRLLEIENTGRQ